ncbi:unnamed protein product [Penicillium bialowiezense]
MAGDPILGYTGHMTLKKAALTGDLHTIKTLLDEGYDVNESYGRYNALAAAASRGRLNVIELLLDRGADLNNYDPPWETPLEAAVGSGNLDAVRLLLDRGANVNKCSMAFQDPLERAILEGSLDIAALLIERGADFNQPGGPHLATAATAPHSPLNFINLLVDAGVDVKTQGLDALQAAAHGGLFDVVQLLLGLGADVNAQGGRGRDGTALQAAITCLNSQMALKVIRLLLDWGADVNEEGGSFGNPLQAATLTPLRSLDIAELLLSQGANVNAKGGPYGSALQASAASIVNDDLDLINLLLDHGADVNAQGGLHGSVLHAAVFSGRYKVVKLLLERGADINSCVADDQGASLLHTAVERSWVDTSVLDLVLEAGAYTYIGHTDAFKQTPLYLAINTPICLQSLQNSLDIALKSEEGRALVNILNSAINEADFDGCTLLYRAVEEGLLDTVKWLIDHGADVHVRNFYNFTAFQRASELRDFSMMTQIFAHVKDGEFDRSVKATDWRQAQHRSVADGGDSEGSNSGEPEGSNWKDNIVLALNGTNLASVQAMDGLELDRYFFFSMSYPLNWKISTPSVPVGEGKCIASAPFQRALVLLQDDKLLNQSSGGVYLKWWRMILERPHINSMLYGTHDDWMWRVQANHFPSAVALSQPSRTQCFLECRVILPSCEVIPTDTLSSTASLTIGHKNHAMIWVLVKPEKNHQPSAPASPEPILECKVVFTTLEDCEIPNLPDDEILMPCIKQLADEWNRIFQAAEEHLSEMRSATFRSNGRSIGLIKDHLTDAQTWNELRTLFSNQMSILRSFHQKFFLRWQQIGLAAAVNPMGSVFVDEINNTEKRMKERLSFLDSTSQELIQLEFNLTSIAEAQKSTSMNTSMKRLSWITFIFLPLMFIASLFGMNIDILASNPSWWLYIPFAAGTIILTLAVWILFKTKKGLEDTIEQQLAALFKRKKVEDEESFDKDSSYEISSYENSFDQESLDNFHIRKKRTTLFSAFGKKRS